MFKFSRAFGLAGLITGVIVFVVAAVSIGLRSPGGVTAAPPPAVPVDTNRQYVVVAWNDLGMHCYNRDFNDLAVLPPANTLWAQVIKVGNPPQIITTGVTVEYYFPINTYSVGKSNFWSTNPYNGVQNARSIFNLPADLPANMGLAGKGLSGELDPQADHFVAEWIPITEYNDNDWNTRDPYQLAQIVVKDANTHAELTRATVVAPVSTEMRCDRCHSNNGDGNKNIATNVVEQNILMKHDEENMDEYPPGHTGSLMSQRPVLCAECHSSNAIGAPGLPGIPSLSKAMHSKHKNKVANTTDGCYNCHPGPSTLCLRDVMSSAGMDCVDCHGTMDQVARNPQPWLNEPRCDTCHNSGQYNQDKPLYRLSKGHGGLYCESCHDSTHAIAPSSQPRDAIKFIELQGHAGTLDTCTVCHSSMPTGPGPHGIMPSPIRDFTFGPNRGGGFEPGDTAVYTHTLQNTGNLEDAYKIEWSSSKGWGNVTPTGPITLTPGAWAVVTATVNVPGDPGVLGQLDTTLITATSQTSPTLSIQVIDVTIVPNSRLRLPLVRR